MGRRSEPGQGEPFPGRGCWKLTALLLPAFPHGSLPLPPPQAVAVQGCVSLKSSGF
uniref:Uncharacterized protein n=1 Tax=Cairina moschata TaxID=8855 RepID=A0A8C3B601_CAIMO